MIKMAGVPWFTWSAMAIFHILDQHATWHLKGQSHKIFDPGFFHESIPLRSLINRLKYFAYGCKFADKFANMCWLSAMPHSRNSALRSTARSRDSLLCGIMWSHDSLLCGIALSWIPAVPHSAESANFWLEFHTKRHSAESHIQLFVKTPRYAA
jgi:hypothetical protein